MLRLRFGCTIYKMSNDPEPLLIWQDDQIISFGYLGRMVTSKIRQDLKARSMNY